MSVNFLVPLTLPPYMVYFPLISLGNAGPTCRHLMTATQLLVLDIGRSVYHFLQYIYIPTRYTM